MQFLDLNDDCIEHICSWMNATNLTMLGLACIGIHNRYPCIENRQRRLKRRAMNEINNIIYTCERSTYEYDGERCEDCKSERIDGKTVIEYSLGRTGLGCRERLVINYTRPDDNDADEVRTDDINADIRRAEAAYKRKLKEFKKKFSTKRDSKLWRYPDFQDDMHILRQYRVAISSGVKIKTLIAVRPYSGVQTVYITSGSIAGLNRTIPPWFDESAA